MLIHIHFTSKHNVSSTNTSYSRRFVYHIMMYLIVIAVVIVGAAVMPVVLKSDEVAAGPGSIYIPGMLSNDMLVSKAIFHKTLIVRCLPFYIFCSKNRSWFCRILVPFRILHSSTSIRLWAVSTEEPFTVYPP